MPKAFISYARDGSHGERLAAEIQQQLIVAGFAVFRDVTGLQAGESFPHRLEFELESSDVMVLVVSAKVRTSTWVYSEFSMAQEIGIPVVPVLVEKIRYPLWVRNLQILDFCEAANWQQLLDAIGHYLGGKEIPSVFPFTKGGEYPPDTPDFDRMTLEKGGARGISLQCKLDTGQDQYGRYVDLTVNGITQRFRWIEPGTFWMGSPESEEGRVGWEIRHQVTLSKGFWLGDTVCTQALWESVMGNNPSNFNDDPNNPVERVNWDDVQEFLKILNGTVSSLNARLPMEAEWEYACRAGTTTPFFFGNNITPEQVNYDGNYPYTNGAKGLYRQKTIPVKSLPANLWGLYEMHGNVWEWCQDTWQENLSAEPITDPQNYSEGIERVVRGGSWYLNGRLMRSAFRSRIRHDERFNFTGFRFVIDYVELRYGGSTGS